MLKAIKKVKNSPKKVILENTVALMILTVLNYILPFITLPYLSRILDVDKLGLVFFAQVVIDYFGRIMNFGFETSGVRSVSICRDNKHELNLLFNSISCVQILLLIISFLVLVLITCFFDRFRQDAIVYYFTFLSVVGQFLLFQWFYQGMEKMKFITILNVLLKTLALILIFVFIKQSSDYYLVPLFNSIGGIIAGIISVILIMKRFGLRFYIPSIKKMKEQFVYSSQFFLSKVCIALYRSTNAFVLGLVLTTTTVAYYVSADRIFWGALALYGAFIGALFPYMSKNKDLLFFRKMLSWAIISSVGASLVLFFGADFLIKVFFSEKMLPSVTVLKVFSLSFMFYFLVDLLGFPLLGAFNYVKKTNEGYIVGGIYNALGLLILYWTDSINILNVSILVSSTYSIIFLHRVYFINKYKIFKRRQVHD